VRWTGAASCWSRPASVSSSGVEVDAERFLQLRDDNEAIFLGLGARQAKEVSLPGRELFGVDDALSYLGRINRGKDGAVAGSLAGKRVLVLGGGDTAMDCARAALRDGASSVAIAYRGTAEKLRANPHERVAAIEEGVSFPLRAHTAGHRRRSLGAVA
jgi:glutamate synthase (NADPH/NADH) small chain